MNSLFGLELSTPVNFIIAFVVVLVLIGAATWAIKRFGTGRLEGGNRGRQPRLAVVDSATVDGRRKLVIVRRDNVEHLLMIGGPTDVVVETSIVRGNPGAGREPAVREPAPWAAAEPLPRTMPLPEASQTAWPLAPEATAVQAEPMPMPSAPAPRAEAPAPRPAEEAHWVDAAPAVSPVPPPPPQRAPAPQAHQAPQQTLHQAPPPPAHPPQEIARGHGSAHGQAQNPATADDANLAEMAQRLEAALRRPAAGTTADDTVTNASRPAPMAATPPRRTEPRLMPRPPLRAARSSGPMAEPARTGEPQMPKSSQQMRSEFEDLEQEMASLLGRPSNGKT